MRTEPITVGDLRKALNGVADSTAIEVAIQQPLGRDVQYRAIGCDSAEEIENGAVFMIYTDYVPVAW